MEKVRKEQESDAEWTEKAKGACMKEEKEMKEDCRVKVKKLSLSIASSP